MLLAPERAVGGALILCLGLPPALWRPDGVRALTLRDGVSECLLPRLPGSAMAERETVGDGAARDETLPQASSENSVAEESSSVRAEGCVRTGCPWASGCKTLAKRRRGSIAKKAVTQRFEGVQSWLHKPWTAC